MQEVGLSLKSYTDQKLSIIFLVLNLKSSLKKPYLTENTAKGRAIIKKLYRPKIKY